MDDLMDWTICGRSIGKATGWDQGDTFVMQIYGFQPHPLYTGPVDNGCVSFDFERGVIQTFGIEGDVVISADLIDSIKCCPVDRID